MREIDPLLHHRFLLAAPAISILVGKALGLLHGASLHTWLLDVQQNLGGSGASGAGGAGAAGGAGGGSDNDPDWPNNPGYGPFHWPTQCFPEPHNPPHAPPPPDTWSDWVNHLFNDGHGDTTTSANGCTKA
jgi:hypothetical protein